jgi:excisionase family DNA binding protein
MAGTVITPKWHTVDEVADMLRFGKSKTKFLVLSGEIRSVKAGRNRRILPEWVDDYIRRTAVEQGQ